MLLDRTVKIIWSIIGLFFLIGIPILAYLIYEKEYRNRYEYYGAVQPESLIIGAELAKAREKGLVIQHLQYDKPEQVSNTDYFILPVYAKSYKQPIPSDIGGDDVISELALSIPDEEASYSSKYANYSYYSDTRSAVNIMFLDQDYSVLRTLLNTKAFIKSFRIPYSRHYYGVNDGQKELPVNNITYTIAFVDSNKDGKLNEEDFADLYISDLDGKAFKQVTSGIDILDYHFMKNNAELLIEYKRRENKPEEQKKKLFATYTIDSGEFKSLDSLHEHLQQLNADLSK
jgi:hypothetical protein